MPQNIPLLPATRALFQQKGIACRSKAPIERISALYDLIRHDLQWAAYLIVFIPILLFTPVLQTMVHAETVITVSGQAPIGNVNAHDEALNQAFRNAIEQTVGIQVTSDTRVKNAEILMDEIYTYSEGFIKHYDILSEQTIDGMLTLEVKSWVKANRLNKALFLNGLDVKKVYAWVGEPRVLIHVKEYIDNDISSLNLAAIELENLFREKGVKVFHQSNTGTLNEQDQEIAFGDTEQAISMGQALGAEIIVSGKCVSNFSRALTIGQFTFNFYSAKLYIQAYNVSTGEVLLSANYSSDDKTDSSAQSKFDAAANAITNCIAISKEDILFNIVRNWYDGFSKPSTHQVTITNIDYHQLAQLKSMFRAFDGVRKIFERSYADRIAQLDIKYEGLQDSLANEFVSSKLPYTILKKEQNRLVLEHH